MSILKVLFPEDFNEKYKEFSDMLLSILKEKEPSLFTDLSDKKTKEKIKTEVENDKLENDFGNSEPHTIIKAGIGYFKFYKEGKNIKIGKEKTRHFRFLQSLCIPKLGTQKTIEEVFEAIKNDKDLKDNVLTGFDSPQKKTKMITIMKNSCIKELQKNQELKKISYKFDNTEKRVWLKLEE